jgi:hypothetical protein
MPYVRARLAPASKEYARRRAEQNRVLLAPDPAHPGARFPDAFDWFRAAAVYARRRSYRTPVIAERAHARLKEITASAVSVLRQSAEEMDVVIPARRRRLRRVELRQACARAAGADRMEPTRQWFLFLAAQARREPGETAAQAAAIQDHAAEWFIRWAEEMDADDYGE